MKQSEALRLADLLEYDAINNFGYHKPLVCASAAELRRLHEVNERYRQECLDGVKDFLAIREVNEELLAALKQIQNANIPGLTFTPELDAAIAKAEGV